MKYFLPILSLIFGNQILLANTFSLAEENLNWNIFDIFTSKNQTYILYDKNSSSLDSISAFLLADDIFKITNYKPEIVTRIKQANGNVIVIGSIHPKFIAFFLNKKDIKTEFENQWKSYLYKTISNPNRKTKNVFIIAGTNIRSTAYDVFNISKKIGASTWYWWADVPVGQSNELFLNQPDYYSNPPLVTYRGIFLNDEDRGLHPWTVKTFEPETGDISPKTYSKIFELLLHLNANTIWPVMHPSTKAFFYYPNNTKMASLYNIVIGTSHAEPMLRNNVNEWDKNKFEGFNYKTNKDHVFKYWETRVKEAKNINTIYTMGMSDVHDSGMEGVIKNIYVVYSGDKVELFVNGTSKGFGKQSKQFLFTFENIKREVGTIKAVNYNTNGKIISKDSKTTAGEPFEIKLTPHTSPTGFSANNADVALVDVEVVDKNGPRCPIDNSLIEFSLKGDATWLGGIAQGPDNYILSKKFPVENGVNRIMIKSGLKTDKINITATSNHLKSAKITLKTRPFITNNGLSTELPNHNLPSNLERGSTPKVPTYTIKRHPVFISHVSVQSNNDAAYNSYDGDELTEWTNDGRISTGQVTYTLAKPSVVTTCVAKLTGWRTKSYPIRILADGEEVYQENTWQSLGYITMPLKQILAKKITIELIGDHIEKDAFDKIVEVDPAKELDLYKNKNATDVKEQLRIVEIEFHESP
ncbi:glycosyl hydrolase 115 family protein [Mariniflexile sp. HMF6888]|uniref:glycosyl hydrolase 115 family protein n=1 Tax=Mariniflexile sp. HMF6888 TaxID=3373086 RepID=UPI0037A278AB